MLIHLVVYAAFFATLFQSAVNTQSIPARSDRLDPLINSSQTITTISAITPTGGSMVAMTTTLSVTATALPTVTYEQLLGVHESVLQTTQASATNFMGFITALTGIGGLIVAALTIIGGYTGMKVYNRISDAAKRADKAALSVDQLEAAVKSLEEKASQTVQRLEAALQILKEQTETASQKAQAANQVADGALQDLQQQKQELEKIKQGAKSDIETIRKSLQLVQIEEYSIELFSDDVNAQRRAALALKEMMDPRRPAFVRRRCVIRLGQFVERNHDPQIVQWLHQIAEDDSAASVSQAAKDVLKNLEKDQVPS